MSSYRFSLPEPYYDRYSRRDVIIESMIARNLLEQFNQVDSQIDNQISIQIEEKSLVKDIIKEDLPIR
jgi:hypothetical protein